jgi:cytochrome bd-type quinol oxidase subunit 2
MSAIRRLASRLLRAAARHSSSATQDWANAMLRELDFIESDWAALFWALGGAAAIFRHSVPRGLRAWLEKRREQSRGSAKESIGKRAAGVTAGIVLVLAVTSLALVLVRQLFYAFPAWDLGSMPWWVAMIVIPEIIFVVAVVALWRKRRSVATGILLSAIVLAVHFVVHAATHVH